MSEEWYSVLGGVSGILLGCLFVLFYWFVVRRPK